MMVQSGWAGRVGTVAGVAVAAAAIDLGAKAAAEAWLDEGAVRGALPFVDLSLTFNHGISSRPIGGAPLPRGRFREGLDPGGRRLARSPGASQPRDTSHRRRCGLGLLRACPDQDATDRLMKLTSTLTCPHCGHRASETMPTDACKFFYECTGCGTLLRPKEGDCCVYCSYGDVPCPSIQEARDRGDGANCCA